MNTNLYNHDGTLSAQAQSLLSPKPDAVSMKDWRKLLEEFKSQLSEKDCIEFTQLRKKFYRQEHKEDLTEYHKVYYQKHKEDLSAKNKTYYQANRDDLGVKNKAYRQANREVLSVKNKAYHQKNKEKRNAYKTAYNQQHKEKVQAYQKTYRERNTEKVQGYQKTCREANTEKRRAYTTEYARARRQQDPLYNFFHSIRSQAVRVVKQVGLGKKPTNTFKWVGCSPEQLKAHIESLFLEGMSWDNYGKYGWHVDHIRPVSSFKPEEWEQINHYTNLQPLWWQDNLSKSNK